MDATCIPRRASGYTIAEFEGEHMIFHPADGRAIYLSESASLVWRLCDGHRTVSAIVQLLHEAFPEASDLAVDVDAALSLFVEQHVVELE